MGHLDLVWVLELCGFCTVFLGFSLRMHMGQMRIYLVEKGRWLGSSRMDIR